MKVLRIVVAALGAAGMIYGLWLLVDRHPEQLAGVGVWVAGGIVAHDGLLAPLVVAGGVALAVRGPGRLRTPLLWAVVVLGPLTLIAVPVLGRFGAKPDNPTLLDRPYWLGYGVVVGLALLLVAAAVVRRERRADRRPTTTGNTTHGAE